MERQDIRNRLEKAVGGAERLASSFAARSFADLNKRAARELDGAADAIVEMLERAHAAVAREGLEEFLEVDDGQLVAGAIAKWAAYQAAGARVANWAVVGPARFPVRSNEKKMQSEHNRLGEYLDFLKGAPDRVVRQAKRAKAEALGAGGMANAELEDLKARLDARELAQRQMKSINEIIRREKLKAGDGERLAQLAGDRGFPMSPNRAGMLLQVDYGRPGYAAYQLSNNNAEIHRLRDRIAQVERKVERIEEGAAPERELNGVKIVEDQADDRLRLFFDGKPPASVIAALKGRGFRWSPRAGAWQRQLNNNARAAAESIINQL